MNKKKNKIKKKIKIINDYHMISVYDKVKYVNHLPCPNKQEFSGSWAGLSTSISIGTWLNMPETYIIIESWLPRRVWRWWLCNIYIYNMFLVIYIILNYTYDYILGLLGLLGLNYRVSKVEVCHIRAITFHSTHSLWAPFQECTSHSIQAGIWCCAQGHAQHR